LATHLIAALKRCGADIVAVAHDRGRVSADLESQAHVLAGDLRDPAFLQDAMRGVSLVYHCAAITNNNIAWKTHYDVNIAGTEAVLRAAAQAGVGRVVHISSVIVYGLKRPRDGRPLSENAPYGDDSDPYAHYLRSKREADRLALEIGREAGLQVTVLRLGILYGPGGRPVGRGLLQLGRLRWIIGGGRNALPLTYVGNAVDCMLLAGITPAAAGQAYNVVDEPQITMRESIRQSDVISGERTIVVPVPTWLVLAAAGILEWRSRRRGSETPPKLSRFVVRSAARDIRYDTSKARQELGWQPAVSLEQGLRSMMESK
jgi:nucleoside-diphosphate-sugar epimerase